jgi:hypothetical protein
VPVEYEQARHIYDKLVKEKRGKGYTVGENGTPYQQTQGDERFTGILPQLLKAKELGWLAEVSDEGHFWDNRDVEALVKEIGSWNEMIAAFGGKLKDLVGGGMEAPITEFPDFERLEAAGQNQLPPGFEQLAKLIGRVAKTT